MTRLVVANTRDTNIPKELRKDDLIRRCVETGEQACIIKALDTIDGIKHYVKTNNKDEIKLKCSYAKHLLSLIPKYSNKVFIELQNLLDKYEEK